MKRGISLKNQSPVCNSARFLGNAKIERAYARKVVPAFDLEKEEELSRTTTSVE
jgi:hypothetical protein